MPGFGVRRQTRRASYILCTTVRGKQRWITIGPHGKWTPDTARTEALRLLAAIQQGSFPQPPRHMRTRISDLADRYLRDHAEPYKKASSVSTDRQNLKNHVLPLLGHLFVDDVSQRDIAAFHNAVRTGKTSPTDPIAVRRAQGGGKVTTGGPGVANRCLTLLSKMFNLAEVWELRPAGSNPVRGIQRFPEKSHDRFLSDPELSRLMATLSEAARAGSESPYAIGAIQLLVLTGARLGEILTLRWEFVDLEAGSLELPESKTGRKSIALNTAAEAVLRGLPRLASNPFVIVGGRDGGHLIDLQRPWYRIRETAGLPDVRIHDLRHSFASLALRNGLSLAVIGKLLGHASPTTTARYSHLSRNDLKAAAEQIGAAMPPPIKPNVAPLDR